MTSKKGAKKRKRAKKKKHKRKTKSAEALFIEKMRKSDDFPGAKIIIDPKDENKMSEVILYFAKPFLDECEDEESEKKAIALAILIWNVSLFPKKDRDKEIQRLISDTIPVNDISDLATMKYYVNMLLERKKKYYPNNKRVIVNYQFSVSRNSRRLDVASTLSP